MQIKLKKVGLVLAASSVFLAANALAESSFYGQVGVELSSVESSSDTNTDSTSGLTFQDNATRFGFKGSEGDVTVTVEYGVGLSGAPGLRHANAMVSLPGGGTLGIGQQNNIRVSDGWTSNRDWDQASALHRGADGSGSRYTGLSYHHDFGAGNFAVMFGADNADGDEGAGNAQHTVDNLGARLTISAVENLTVQIGYGSAEADIDGVDAETDVSAQVTYETGGITAYVGYASNELVDETTLNETNSNDLALNVAADLGSINPFAGFRTRTHELNGADLEDETGVTVGVNFDLFGGDAFAQFDSWTNEGGTDGADRTEISTGVLYSF